MTFTIDPERLFWWVAMAGVLIAVGCLAADTTFHAVRVVAELTHRKPLPNRKD